MAEVREPSLPFPSRPLRGARPGPREIGGRICFWAPVWAAMVVLAQIALLGLRPALAEGRRLRAAERELEGRLAREVDRRASLERALRAQDDPIYLERERRLLRAENGPLAR
jgi:hypothetical protein